MYEVDGVPVVKVTSYTYDALGQLESETSNGVTTKFGYDNYGNIVAKGIADENGEIAEATKITYAYNDEHWHDLLVSYNGQTISYDVQGNPTEYLGHNLTWEKGRQLKSFDNNTYSYNANGIRTSKTVDCCELHEYVLEGSKILKETWNGNTLVPLYDNSDSVCGIVCNGISYFFLKNLQGDIIAITNSDGDTVAKYSYDAWGKCTIDFDNTGYIANINPFRYRGYYLDRETGLYYLNSRYYDANTGRFINVDSPEYVSVQGGNLFAYGGNCPTKNADYFGFCYVPTYPESYVPNNSGSSTNGKSKLPSDIYRESWIFREAKKYGFTINKQLNGTEYYPIIDNFNQLGVSVNIYYSVGYAHNYSNKKGIGFDVNGGATLYLSFDCGNGVSVGVTGSNYFLKYAITISIAYCSHNYGLFGALNIEASISKLTILGAKVAVAIIALVCVYCPVAIPYIESAFRVLMGIGTATGTATATSVAALSFAAAPA